MSEQSATESASVWDMPTLGGSVLRYVEGRRQAGEFSPTTVRAARWALWHFAEIVGIDKSPRNLTRRHIDKWVTSRATVAPTTLRSQLSHIRMYCRWLVEHGVLKKDPTAGVRGPPYPRLVPRAMASGDVAHLLTMCPDIRARLIVSLMVQEGLRCIEVAGLQRSDVDFVDETLFIVGKGGHQRLLPLSDDTRTELRRYLDEYPANAGPLLRSFRNPQRGLTPHYISDRVSLWMGDAHVRGSAHALRSTMASDMLDRGANVRDVQSALGHASLGTTQRYLRRSEGKKLREAMGGRHYT